jgi:hypothetical protein
MLTTVYKCATAAADDAKYPVYSNDLEAARKHIKRLLENICYKRLALA